MVAPSLVLLIEDNEDFQNLYGMVAEEAGFTVEHIYNGLQALARLDQEPLPQVILLDSRLPGASGTEILKAVRSRQNWSKVLVYIMTADVRGAEEFREPAPGEPQPDGVIEKSGATIRALRDLFKEIRAKMNS